MKAKEKILDNQKLDDLFEIVELEDKASEHLDIEPYSYWKSVLKEFIKKPSAVVSFIALILVITLSIVVPIISSYDPFNVEIEQGMQFIRPNLQHLFGTDKSGADIWTKVWYGARTSVIIALIVASLNAVVGIFVGTIWGYFKKLDPIMIEIYNFVQNVPALLYQMLLMYVFKPSYGTLIFALTVTGWLGMARGVRNLIIIYSNREYNIASRTLGTPASRIIINNLLPYILTVIVTSISLSIPGVISAEVGLTYLGLGLPPGVISLGRVLKEGYQYFLSHPHVLYLPALVTGSITIIFYLIGLALADAMDPKNHR